MPSKGDIQDRLTELLDDATQLEDQIGDLAFGATQDSKLELALLDAQAEVNAAITELWTALDLVDSLEDED